MIWGNAALPDNLKGKKHNDWPWGLRWVPRAWTAFAVPWYPQKLIGNQQPRSILVHPNTPQQYLVLTYDPVPKNGYWSIQTIKLFSWLPYLPLYFTIVQFHWHFRIGIRWDSVDNYYVPDIALTHQTSD
jgi:hypothetical protein